MILNMFTCVRRRLMGPYLRFIHVSYSWTYNHTTYWASPSICREKRLMCSSKVCRIYYNSTFINKKQQLQKYVQVYFFFKILVASFRNQFQLGPMFSLCNAASSAVFPSSLFTPRLEELDTTQILLFLHHSLWMACGSREQTLLGRAETSTIWRLGVVLSEHNQLLSAAVTGVL